MKPSLLELAERCEKAAGPDRDLDIALALAQPNRFFNAGPYYEGAADRIGVIQPDGTRSLPGQGPDMLVPRYTASLDAAMTLVDDQLVTVVMREALDRLDECFNPLDNYLTKLRLFVCAAALRASNTNKEQE
jgi:hypothetical protein